MNPNDLPADTASAAELLEFSGANLLLPLLAGAARAPEAGVPITGIVIGELLALGDDGATAFVCHPAQAGTGAVAARTAVDLHASHIGAAVVLMFEEGDPERPVVMGALRGRAGWPAASAPENVEVDADGRRLVVTARDQLVLRCGQASITLTKAGKVLIDGTYVCSRASGANRVKGASIQLN